MILNDWTLIAISHASFLDNLHGDLHLVFMESGVACESVDEPCAKIASGGLNE
jgi:hypothetical protein